MKKYLSPTEYTHFLQALAHHQPIPFPTADAIAQGLLRWATERGATHYTHWFQPITGTCAEKHDTFLDTLRDGETPLLRFTGKQLIMGEPDGSSFPSGGLRATHVARGYTAWDPHSPPFILQHGNGATLYIPSCFFSWDNNQALDEKIPLLRSEVALSRQTMRLFGILGDSFSKHHNIHMDAGLEQEFFLIERNYYLKRPDLMTTGRTVLGAAPPKGQELEDQYFGPLSTRFLDCIHDFEMQCWKLGIPIQTRHREVAPGQYEVAPKFAPANVGTDRNLIMMELLKRTARKHGLAALLHEKPFAGVNGSGKHNNWSLGSNESPSLLNPGPHPEKNHTFMLFLAATIRAIDIHSDLMRVAISGVGNDHRLGANEAPPAIVSCYLGDDIEKSVLRFTGDYKEESSFVTKVDLSIPTLPDLHRVPTDRNRTSTFAFTGNKFEFRAVGSSHNPARSNTVLNTIVADSIRFIADEIEARLKKNPGTTAHDLMLAVVKETIKKHRRIIFNGNGYSAEWAEEAARRGLLNLKSTPAALDLLYSKKNIDLFSSLSVLSFDELQARSNILFEDYVKRINIEGRVMVNMVKNQILPIGFKYQKKMSDSIQSVEESTQLKTLTSAQKKHLTVVAQTIDSLIDAMNHLEAVLGQLHHHDSPQASAHYAEKDLIAAMKATRTASDKLETLLPADEWPFPTYHQMLFHQD